jgi:hypothetical protein
MGLDTILHDAEVETIECAVQIDTFPSILHLMQCFGKETT